MAHICLLSKIKRVGKNGSMPLLLTHVLPNATRPAFRKGVWARALAIAAPMAPPITIIKGAPEIKGYRILSMDVDGSIHTKHHIRMIRETRQTQTPSIDATHVGAELSCCHYLSSASNTIFYILAPCSPLCGWVCSYLRGRLSVLPVKVKPKNAISTPIAMVMVVPMIT